MYYLDSAPPFIIVWEDCKDDKEYLECCRILNAPYFLIPVGRRIRKDYDSAFMQYCFKSENIDKIIEQAVFSVL